MLYGMKKVLGALCFSTAMLSLPFFVERANGSFRLAKIAIKLPSDPAWDSPLHSPEARDVLSNPFSYVSRGAQAYVFASEDGQFVLKLFRGSPRSHRWNRYLRHRFLGKKERRGVLEKIPALFAACQLAYTKVPELTGLVYMHLNATKDLLPNTFLINGMKKKIPIDLNHCRFVLQKKGRPIRDSFLEAVHANDQAKYRRLARAFVSLLEERTLKNIGNLDRTIWYNFGFVGETAIEWDFGRYYYNPDFQDRSFREQEIALFTKSLQRFLDDLAPDWPVNLSEYKG